MNDRTQKKSLPITVKLCVTELDRIADYEKAIVKRMKEFLNGNRRSSKRNEAEDALKELADFSLLPSEKGQSLVGAEAKSSPRRADIVAPQFEELKDEGSKKPDEDGSRKLDWDSLHSLRTQLTLMEDSRSSPLIDALKRVEWGARDHAEITKWCSELATLFYKADEDMTGKILEDQYIGLIKMLPLSDILKDDLCGQFFRIDHDRSGTITLDEFLFFFLNFPPFRKELGNSFTTNEPYHSMFNNIATWKKVRLWVYKVVTVPGFNVCSRILYGADLLLAIVPFVMLYLELIDPSIHPEKISVLFFLALFSAVQYVAGLVTCDSKMKYLMNAMHIIELMSFLPWSIYNISGWNRGPDWDVTAYEPSEHEPYLVGSHGAIGFLLLRILRAIWLPKVLPTSKWLKEDFDIYVKTIRLALSSYKPLATLFLFMVIFLSTLVYAFERGIYNGCYWERFEDEESPFSNFFNCVWYTLVTFTTLGYGDFYPHSYEGKVVGMMVVVIGLVNITILINTIGECFEESFRTFLENQSRDIKNDRSNYIKQQVQLAEIKLEEMRQRHKRSSHYVPKQNIGNFDGVVSSEI